MLPSPDPDFVMHGISIRTLVHAGIIVLAAGGGGIPVFIEDNGNFNGIDAVIDKDLTAAKLGRVIRADEYYIVTDINQVYLHYGTENQSPIDQMTDVEAKKYLEIACFSFFVIWPIGVLSKIQSLDAPLGAAVYMSCNCCFLLSYSGSRADIIAFDLLSLKLFLT